MINEVALLLGMLGTGMLALDVATPSILTSLSNSFRNFANQSIFPRFLFRRNYEPTDEDRENLNRIRIIGFFSLLVAFGVMWVAFPELESILNSYAWVISIPFILALAGYGALSFSEMFARILITSSTLLMLPFFYVFFIVFGILGVALRLILLPIVSLENSVIGQEQSPRFLGLLILFLSFFLQLIALKS
ncbi:hypothetical protein ACEWBJ_22565 [Vibrio parahaemolyticus]|uniref:hypothetical protein n=1 Tax=Vibrio harveyi group TaxID=717610 RepID=UPI0013755489|nr:MULTISPECIES: hypothetical protein [Vibrio harveyi group]EJG1536601.1 hypothetical protein [Vibrio parahaemolyticus]ELS3154570.1 hypothetical protein [Vibrio parahaemolyticus]MBE4008417.1 hypothetical protein [Vibrio parahaemolyticus]MBS9970725.1 hypothetical protein [Vibrio alginolyticus]MCF9126295.1 hypothetical protein [Vibrio parahaemolyticus]